MERIVNSVTAKTLATVSAAVVSTGILSVVIGKFMQCQIGGTDKTKPKKWVRVGNVSKLILYPVKSCAGAEFSELEATAMGLKGPGSVALRDRIFLVVDYKYSCQQQRIIPKMGWIQAEVKGQEVTLSAPETSPITFPIPENVLANKRSCRIWDDHVREVLDCGDEIGKWLDTYFGGTGYRLVYHAVDHTQRVPSALEKRFPQFVPEHKGSFQDVTSYMMMTEESIAEVKKTLPSGSAVTYKNFRPSIVIQGVSEPFAEELWSYVRIGSETGPILKVTQPCARCRLTTIDPDTAQFDPEGQPLKTIVALEKRSVGDEVVDKLIKDDGILGIHLGLYQEGSTIKVGDPVYAALL